MIEVADTVVKITNDLEPEGKDINIKLKKILGNEIRRRLNRYELINNKFCKKYRMSFEEFKKAKMVEKLNYSFEVESDFCNWEMAISGIRCLKKNLISIGN